MYLNQSNKEIHLLLYSALILILATSSFADKKKVVVQQMPKNPKPVHHHHHYIVVDPSIGNSATDQVLPLTRQLYTNGKMVKSSVVPMYRQNNQYSNSNNNFRIIPVDLNTRNNNNAIYIPQKNNINNIDFLEQFNNDNYHHHKNNNDDNYYNPSNNNNNNYDNHYYNSDNNNYYYKNNYESHTPSTTYSHKNKVTKLKRMPVKMDILSDDDGNEMHRIKMLPVYSSTHFEPVQEKFSTPYGPFNYDNYQNHKNYNNYSPGYDVKHIYTSEIQYEDS